MADGRKATLSALGRALYHGTRRRTWCRDGLEPRRRQEREDAMVRSTWVAESKMPSSVGLSHGGSSFPWRAAAVPSVGDLSSASARSVAAPQTSSISMRKRSLRSSRLRGSIGRLHANSATRVVDPSRELGRAVSEGVAGPSPLGLDRYICSRRASLPRYPLPTWTLRPPRSTTTWSP